MARNRANRLPKEQKHFHPNCEPWVCYCCGEDVWFDDLHVHHLNKLRWDNSFQNLAPAHSSCHLKCHQIMRKFNV